LKRVWLAVAGTVALGLLGAAAFVWWPQPAPPVATSPAPQPQAIAPPAPPAAASEPAVRYPVEPEPATAASAAPPDVEALLTELFGRKVILSMFQMEEFPRRFVATVDNLGRSHAPVSLWPVNPVGGRLLVETQGGRTVVSADNSMRYTPYVLLVETVDLRQVVAVYRKIYPLLQRAYEELGYPRRYFNDRLVAVIDQLLATPDVSGPIEVTLPAINGPVRPVRPWVLYEFADPALQQLSAGQRILLRMGPVNERRMKVKLAEVRRLLVAGEPQR
jgi:hypothetical protein